MHRLKMITDPVGDATEYAYSDADNPMRVTSIQGPGAANEAELSYGCATADHRGQVAKPMDPNGATQGFQYSGRNIIRNLTERIGPDTGEAMCPGANGGEFGECPDIALSMASSPTGETRLTGTETCMPVGPPDAGSNCRAAEPLELGIKCSLCGCATDYDESGSVINMSEMACTDVGPVASVPSDDDGLATPPGVSSVGLNSPPYCSGPEHPFDYDGNQQLVCAWHHRFDMDTEQTLDVSYRFTYDARRRMADYEVLTVETDIGPGMSLYPHCQQFPSLTIKHEYSNRDGKFRSTYRRELEPALQDGPMPPDPVFRTFDTVYATDLAGRIAWVAREGKVTTYAYADSTVLPAVTETRPDGSNMLVFLDRDGMVCTLAHELPNGLALARNEYARDAKGRITQASEEIQDSQAVDEYRSDVVSYTYGDGNLSPSDLDGGGLVPNAGKLYYDYLANLGGGRALLDADPNRLVMERRTNQGPDGVTVAVKYVREYWYDPGGNRLAMRPSAPGATPALDVPISTTRYNYFTGLVDLTGGAAQMPGTPMGSADIETD